jgi:protein arginine N-methyltransferase 5
LEKNPFALDILRHRKQTEPDWKHVELVSGDMREFKFEFPVDLLVTELLGSFGCNEASPECVQRFLANHPETQAIPQSYTSFVAPVTCREVHAALSAKETLYVVNFARHLLVAEEQATWTFKHRSRTGGDHDSTSSLAESLDKDGVVAFTSALPGEVAVHGLAGFFEACLYKYVAIGNRKSFESKSWFPCFFPFKDPVLVKPGDTFGVEIRRRSVLSQVMWYEWRPMLNGEQFVWQNKEGSEYSVSLDAGNI